ncbi:MAG: cyclic nucleotide-binding domain-containing protein [Deltaproteobacteria bacterium]|nr:cyclic nucleotide-binding domain-containing protein [Deltaproteobacteria bacterium]
MTVDPSQIPLLRALSEAARQAIQPLLTTRRVRSGELVFAQGDPAEAAYLVRAGQVEVVKHAHGHELVLNRLGPGDVFGVIGVLQERAHSASIRALTELELVVVPADFVRLARDLDPVGLAEVYRLGFAATADHLDRADVATVGYFVDLIEMKKQDQLERELRHLLVHDLRSPLAICEAGIVQLLDHRDRMGPLTPKQERALRRSRRSAVFMRGLVDEILEVARTDGGGAQLATTTAQDVLFEALTQVLGGVGGPNVDDVEPGDFAGLVRTLASQDVHVEADAATLSRPLVVDRFRLVQVVMNLVGNAAKHAPGWLAIRLRAHGARLELAVVDRGPGIPAHLRKAVFELYRQVDLKQDGVRRGFGLGLAGAARLVEALGGTIEVGDGDGGVGTAMRVSLPWAPAG